MALSASDIMSTQVVTVTPATPVSEFARICAEDNISGAPVVAPDGAVVGIVSRTDLVQNLLDRGRRFGARKDAPAWDMEGREVQDIMNPDVLTVAPDTPVSEIAERMAEDRIHRVLVMKKDKLVGIVTSIDILAYYPKDE
jgi:CBS domain-containing protein